MVEEKTEEKQEQKTTEDNLIDSANKAAERVEKAREDLAKENDRMENLLARERLGGKTEGAPQEETEKTASPAEYAKQVLAGEIGKV